MGETNLKLKILHQRSYYYFSLDLRLPMMIEGFGEHGIKASFLQRSKFLTLPRNIVLEREREREREAKGEYRSSFFINRQREKMVENICLDLREEDHNTHGNKLICFPYRSFFSVCKSISIRCVKCQIFGIWHTKSISIWSCKLWISYIFSIKPPNTCISRMCIC